jgi:ketosteroid isomerase-like protein
MAADDATRRGADISEIRNIIARIALAADLGDLEEFASLYSADATVQMRVVPDLPPDVGLDAILAGAKKRRAGGITGPGSGMVHAIQSSAISVSGDKAASKTYVALYGNAHTRPELSAILIYSDSFARTADGWRLSERSVEPVPKS